MYCEATGIPKCRQAKMLKFIARSKNERVEVESVVVSVDNPPDQTAICTHTNTYEDGRVDPVLSSRAIPQPEGLLNRRTSTRSPR
jgi:hypothetical protein